MENFIFCAVMVISLTKTLSVLKFENKAICGENKNVFVQNSTKDRINHFNISVIVQCHRDNNK